MATRRVVRFIFLYLRYDEVFPKTTDQVWHNSLFVQTFQLKEKGNIELEMRYPKNKDEYEIVLKVLFTKVE